MGDGRGRSGFGDGGFWGTAGLGAIGCFLGMAGPRALLRLTHPTSEVCTSEGLYVGGFVLGMVMGVLLIVGCRGKIKAGSRRCW